ncbi:MAG TPA: metalloregulator ArsR/SmtB family transcription factor [Acidimicrobiales bacterium]|nr:MAG: transcriptional regulator [Actinobacteria bacterium 21-73-9]HQU25779.1 metalloregulator ArsR/SmtB family transcription factor [Acidimicrobiales bacterium]
MTNLDQPLYVAKAELFRALGHPTRIRILELLVERERPVSELIAETGVESSSLSQHLAVVRHTGLALSTRQGNVVTYRMSDPSVADFLAAARAVLAATLGRSADTLAHLDNTP